MRIFYASDSTPNASFQSNLWRNNLYQPLVDLGHDVVEFEYDSRETFQNLDPSDPKQKAFIDKNRPRLEQALLSQIKAAHTQKPIDLFFSYFYSACVRPAVIEDIKALGIKTVNWYCNAAHQFYLIKELAPAYDWSLVPEKIRLDDYRRIDANPIYCQEAANPNIYKPQNVPVEFDVTFVGQAYGERVAYIRYLLDSGIDVRVWGYGWKNFSPEAAMSKKPDLLRQVLHIGKSLLTATGWQTLRRQLVDFVTLSTKRIPHVNLEQVVLPVHILGDVLSDEEMIRMYSRSKINLGFSACGNYESGERILQVRLRDFEVPMSGGFYMVEYMEELEEFFDIGKEIVCYTNKDDLVDKIKYYLEHDSERERIRRAGYEQCQKNHTWHKRFETVFHEMGLS